MFPENIVQMTFSQYESELIPHYEDVSVKNPNDHFNTSFDNSSLISLFDNTTSKKNIDN